MNELNKRFIENTTHYDLSLSYEHAEAFKIYADFLLEKNKQFNLTSHTDLDTVYKKGFLDSLSLIPHLKTTHVRILDIGTGAGFPGIPLAIVLEYVEIHLLESNLKKIRFLEEVIQLLNLKNVKCIHMRAEEYESEEKYDYVISRAVAKMPLLVEFGYPLVKVGGQIIGYKGKNLELEMVNSGTFLNQYHLEYRTVDARLKDTEHKFAIVTKNKNKYLKRRTMAKIKKHPLW